MWKFSNDKPVYIQAADIIMLRIASGLYKPGEQIPEVIALSEEARTNPNTMQKSIDLLAEQGYLTVLKTSGVFVTEDEQLIREYRDNRSDSIVSAFVENMESLGISKDDIPAVLGDYLKNNK